MDKLLSFREFDIEKLMPHIAQYWSTCGINGNQPTEITQYDLGELVQLYLKNSIPCITDQNEGKELYGHCVITHAYLLLVHPEVGKCFATNKMFVKRDQYPRPSPIQEEIGSIMNVRIIEDNRLPILINKSALGDDVYQCLFFGLPTHNLEYQSSDFINLLVTLP